MRFCSLGSGSTGNATLVEAQGGLTTSRLLIDCGFSLRTLEQRLARAGVEADDISAVFVTHEHGDHVGCALSLAKRHGVPLFMSRGTWRAMGEPELPRHLLHFARDGSAIEVGDLLIKPYTVSHDAQEPLQLRVSDGAHHLGVLTDAGISTPHLIKHLLACDALLLECNHDRALLAGSAYPASLKARIGGRLGHLANDVAAEILSACQHAKLKHLVAAHLSERNNTPALVRTALSKVLGGASDDVVIADPANGSEWLDLGFKLSPPAPTTKPLDTRRELGLPQKKSRLAAAFFEHRCEPITSSFDWQLCQRRPWLTQRLCRPRLLQLRRLCQQRLSWLQQLCRHRQKRSPWRHWLTP